MPHSYIKPYLKFSITALIFLNLLSVSLFSQEDCGSKIQEAQRYYDQGMIDEIPSMLAPCMADGFTRTQKIEAYKLIIMSYLFAENQFEAERTMLEFLTKYPEYEIMPNDPVEFVYLFESYRTASVFSFGLSGGLNFTDPRIIEPFSTFDLNEATLKNIIKPGFQVGLGIERYISRNFMLNLETYFALNQYMFSDEIRDAGTNRISYVTFREKLYKIEVPISLTYEFTINKTHFIVRAGGSAAKITGVSGEPSRKFSEDIQALTGASLNMIDYRKQMLYSGLIGAGVRYKVPRGIVSLDLRAKMGLNSIVKTDQRDETLLNRFYYLDDNFSLNDLSLSVGYYFSFYNPRKQR
ncbi:MAG TPA: outer membrane beta-barrel protein [Bacteroidales bacterium]|jgi:hypothetical protein|nr:outer membrane beta-barrel protein [Bacteroidales bacterium]